MPSTEERSRPNPEELLRAVNRENSQVGTLRIFLGMCPGVGKTYAMLKAAQELKASNKRVVVGYVETHNRKDTDALLEGLASIPPLEINYRGAVLKEFDLESALRLRPIPDALLIDELAHHNIPGSKHLKRYQDVQELLHLGFNVFTTINIQHLESRKDQVAQITGVVMRETVPDSFFEEAHEVEVVDLSPKELLKRLAEGKVYLGERAARAQQNFFQEEKLTALRELALRFTAEKVDQDLNQQMALKGIEGPWNTNERLLVAVSSSPYSARLIRSARRMAYNLDAPWIALYVDTGNTLSPPDQDNLQKNLALAQELGAEVQTIADVDIVDAIQKVAEDKNVTQIVMGRPDKRFFRDFYRGGSLLDQLVKTVSQIDIHVLRAERSPKFRNVRGYLPIFSTKISAYFLTSAMIAGVSGFFYSLLPLVGHRFLGAGFLLALIILSAFARRGLIVYASIAYALIWFFAFISPPFSILQRKPEDFMLVMAFFLTAIIAGWLTARLRKQEVFLRKRESRSALLYDFTTNISEVDTADQLIDVMNSAIHTFMPGEVKIVLALPTGELDFAHGKETSDLDLNLTALANWVYEHKQKAGKSTTTLSGLSAFGIPILSDNNAEGVLLISPKEAHYSLTLEDETFLTTLSRQAGNCLEKLNLEKLAAGNSRLLERVELHNAMIHTLNLDVKGPIEHSLTLAGELLSTKDDFVYNKSKDLIKTIKRMDLVVDNLIYLSKLEGDKVHLDIETIDCPSLLHDVIEEIVPAEDLPNLRLNMLFTGQIIGDPLLLKQAFMNLLNFALRFSPPGGEIDVKVYLKERKFSLEITDEGQNIDADEAAELFNFEEESAGEEFLGLNIVKNVIELHGGQVKVYNITNERGNCFEVVLPENLVQHPTENE